MIDTKRITLKNGLNTRVFDSGTNKPIVILIHGLANSIEIWERVIPNLTSQYRVIALDIPGFGEADRPEADYDSRFFVEQLLAFMDAMKIAKAHLVGSSLGGSIVVRFTEHHQSRVNRAVIAAPGGFGRKANFLMRLPALPVIGYYLGKPTSMNNAITIRLAMYDQKHATPNLVALVNQYASKLGSHRSFWLTLKSGVGVFGVKDRDHFAEIAKAMQCPTLVIWGREDRVFPSSQADIAMGLLPKGTLKLVDHCGHYPQWEQPEVFVAAVTKHLSSALQGTSA